MIPFLQAPGGFILAFCFEFAYGNIILVLFLSYVINPFSDYISSKDRMNIPQEKIKAIEKDKRFLIPLYGVLILDYIMYGYLLFGISSGRIGKSVGEFAIYVISGGTLGGINTIVGHELIHRRSKFHKLMGRLPWFKMMGTYLYIYHVQLHHKFVGHPDLDPTYPPKGLSVYNFIRLSEKSPLFVTWNYEASRL